MLITQQDREVSSKEGVAGGKGALVFENFLKNEILPPHIRLFAEVVIEPGCSLGRHTHTGECEFYLMQQGEAVYDDNGVKCIIKKGDVTYCPNGEFHGMENRGSETVRFTALIVTE